MKSKFVVSLFAFFVLLAGVAQAQDHSKVDIFAGIPMIGGMGQRSSISTAVALPLVTM
jgi:hypothetical protein